MKQWLYYGWVTFKHWFLFTSWTIFHSKEDRAELVKLYNERLFQKKQMAIYVAHISKMKSDDDAALNLYIGDLKSNYLGIVDDYYKQKAEEEKPKD